MKNSVPFVSAICFMACLMRLACEEKEETVILLVMAFINAFAFLFVVYILIHNAIEKVKKEIDEYTADKNKKNKAVIRINIICNLVILVVFITFGWFYMKIHCGLGNDILAIAALGISIISDEVSNSTAKIIIRIVQKNI